MDTDCTAIGHRPVLTSGFSNLQCLTVAKWIQEEGVPVGAALACADCGIVWWEYGSRLAEWLATETLSMACIHGRCDHVHPDPDEMNCQPPLHRRVRKEFLELVDDLFIRLSKKERKELKELERC